MQTKAFTIWFTGLPRSGKSTVARRVIEKLRERRCPVEFLNSAKIRKELNRSLGYSREEIGTSVQRIGYECSLLNRNGLIAVVTAVSPYREHRDAVREQIGTFVEVYCRAAMETLLARDEAGLFRRAQAGEIQHVAGINAPFEEPLKPEVLLNTDSIDVEACATKVLATLEVLGLIGPVDDSTYTPEEVAVIKARLRDLGYL